MHGLDRSHDIKGSTHGALGVVLVRLGPAEVHHQPIAKVLCDVPLETGHNLAAGTLIGPHDFAQLLRIELTGQLGRAHEVAEHHGQLPALRMGSFSREIGVSFHHS